MYPNVKAEMARRGMSIKDLAKAMGCSGANLCKKLNGKIVLTYKEATRIKAILGVDTPLEDLFAEAA